MVVAALIETADYKNFKMLCAYVNRVRHYLYLLRLERKEIPGVRYEPINWFDRVTLVAYAKDPAKDGKDPVLKDMNVPEFPGYRAFSVSWKTGLFANRRYDKDTRCKKQKGGNLLKTLFTVMAVAEAAAYVIDRVAFMSIDRIFNAYRWYLLEYMRKCIPDARPCITHDYISVGSLRTTGKLFRGQGAFQELKDERIEIIKKARPSFPNFSHYLKEVDTIRKTNKTRRKR